MMMKYTIEFDGDKLIREVMENFPEASSPSLRCTSWKYKDDKYTFVDVEEGKTYELDLGKLRKGMHILLDLLANGKLPGISRYVMPDLQDAGNWDADAADALVQCSIFGEVIYG